MGKAEKFTEAMLNNYRTAKAEMGYNANYFLQMINERKGVGAARALLASKTYSDGLTELVLYDRLDLSVEVLVLNEKWRDLFTVDELDKARQTLQKLGYNEQGQRL